MTTSRRLVTGAGLVAAAVTLSGCFSSAHTTSTSTSTITTTTLTSTTLAPTTTTTADSSATTLLKEGSSGPAVRQLQEGLIVLGYRPGAPDGNYGAATASAVMAFQKRNGLQRDGVAGPQVMDTLRDPTGRGPRSGVVPRVEVDIARQIAFVILPGRPVITLNVSTGNGERYSVPGGGSDVADTPVGRFTILRKVAATETAPLGTLYYPMYFYRGWALHGSPSVPGYPASHGCVRMSIADDAWLFAHVPVATPVILYDTTGKSPTVNQLPGSAVGGA